MYICSCHAVTDGAIRAAVASGTKTLAQLAKKTGIATGCGICGREAKRLFYEALRNQQALEAAQFTSSPALPTCKGECGGCAGARVNACSSGSGQNCCQSGGGDRSCPGRCATTCGGDFKRKS